MARGYLNDTVRAAPCPRLGADPRFGGDFGTQRAETLRSGAGFTSLQETVALPGQGGQGGRDRSGGRFQMSDVKVYI